MNREVCLGVVAVTLATLATASGAASVTIYRSIDRDGSVTLSQVPEPGSRHWTAIEVRTPSPEEHRAALARELRMQPAYAAVDRRVAQRSDALRKADRELRDAHAALVRAQAALEAGAEPREGERIANLRRPGQAVGTTRPTQAYFERQLALEERVARAQDRVERAQEALNALK